MGPSSFVVCNLDDPHFDEITADVTAPLKSVSIKNPDADFYTRILSNQLTGLVIELEGEPIQLALSAEYNAYNILSAYTVAMLLGQNKADLKKTLPGLKTVEGRFDQVISANNIIGVVPATATKRNAPSWPGSVTTTAIASSLLPTTPGRKTLPKFLLICSLACRHRHQM